jgi:hypothetical protein
MTEFYRVTGQFRFLIRSGQDNSFVFFSLTLAGLGTGLSYQADLIFTTSVASTGKKAKRYSTFIERAKKKRQGLIVLLLSYSEINTRSLARAP